MHQRKALKWAKRCSRENTIKLASRPSYSITTRTEMAVLSGKRMGC